MTTFINSTATKIYGVPISMSSQHLANGRGSMRADMAKGFNFSRKEMAYIGEGSIVSPDAFNSTHNGVIAILPPYQSTAIPRK